MLISLSVFALAATSDTIDKGSLHVDYGEQQNEAQETSTKVLGMATNWLECNYRDYYDLKDISATITRKNEIKNETRYTVSLSCKTKIKVDNVDELPFIKGLNAELDSKQLQPDELSAISAYKNRVSADAGFGEYRDLAVDVVIINNHKQNTWDMYYLDDMETILYTIDELALDADEMFAEGRNAAQGIITQFEGENSRGYSSYDRIAARDYALDHSSNPTSCYDDGPNCTVVQDRTKWNNSEYPYFSLFKHSDCADFVSQAMSAGGLPEGGTWFRTKNVSTQSWGAAWTSVGSLKEYMTDASHEYWDSSTYALCNAGNILLTSDEHVVMITLNDTITHRYTGHTNDRKDRVFSDVSSYQYYTINAT